VACANVAGLLTSRAPARAKEMAMRVAIGAGRARLVRQLLTESLLIAIGGAVVGLLFGYVSIRFFQRMQIPTDLPVTIGFQMDRRALLLSLAVATASAFLFGLAPALQTSRVDLTAVMKSADTATVDGGAGGGACSSSCKLPWRWSYGRRDLMYAAFRSRSRTARATASIT
jgi:ABC-type antimicrobial peptide transport system permease subunit